MNEYDKADIDLKIEKEDMKYVSYTRNELDTMAQKAAIEYGIKNRCETAFGGWKIMIHGSNIYLIVMVCTHEGTMNVTIDI